MSEVDPKTRNIFRHLIEIEAAAHVVVDAIERGEDIQPQDVLNLLQAPVYGYHEAAGELNRVDVTPPTRRLN